MKVLQQQAYVLHTRAYRESSLIVELFTSRYGRMAGVAKGVRGRKRAGNPLQPFVPQLVSWVGRGPLFTLTGWETASVAGRSATALAGDYLAGGFYMNELLIRLLEPFDVHESLYTSYAVALAHLAAAAPMSVVLRRFELDLLTDCGYAPDLRHCSAGAIEADGHYELDHEAGFRRCSASQQSIPGHVLLAIAAQDYSSKLVRRAALELFRELFRPHLGSRPLASRQLLQSGGNA